MVKIFNELLNQWVDVPERPKRVASLSPSITATLVKLGLKKELVGATCWCRPYLEGAEPSIFASVDKVDYTRLGEIKPEIILTTSGIHSNLALELHSKGYSVFPLPLPNNIFGILSNMVLVGTVVGRQREARQLTTNLWVELESSKVDVKDEERPRVYCEMWPRRFSTTCGGLAFINDLLYAAGGCNVFSEKPLAYFTADPSEVAALNPHLMIFVFENLHEMRAVDVPSLIDRRRWSNLEAVKKGRIVTVLEKDLPLTHSGPSFVKTIKLLRIKFKELYF